MADTNITAAVAGAFIPEVWSREVKKATENKLYMAKLVMRFDQDVVSKGDTIHVPNLSNITATYKVANTDVAQSATTESTTDITINKQGVARVDIEDITKAQADYNLLSLYTQKMGYALGLLVDDDLMALYSGLSQTVGSTASNVGIAKSYVLGAIQKLDAANAPLSDRHWVVESYGRQDLFEIDDFVRYDAAGQGGSSNTIVSGKLGTIFGVEVHYTENTPTSGSIISSIMFHKEAFALAMQKSVKVEKDYEAKRMANVVVASNLYGVAEYRDTFGCVIQYGNA
jgi:hypothetical protein